MTDYKERLKLLSNLLIWALFLEVLFIVIGLLIPSIAHLMFILSVLMFAPGILGYFIAAGRLGRYLDKKVFQFFSRLRGKKKISSVDIPRFFSLFFILLPIFFYIAFGLTIELYDMENYGEVLSSLSFYNLFIGLNSIFVIVMILKLVFTRKTDAPDFSPEVELIAKNLGFIEETEDGFRGIYKEKTFYIEDFLEGMQLKTPNPHHRYIPVTTSDEDKLQREVGIDIAKKIFEYKDEVQDVDFDAEWCRIILRNTKPQNIVLHLDLLNDIVDHIKKPE